ncbi:SsrA-binding protein SmpB [Treponema pedis]|uniref:SsrA-binding protein n=2 Tax=Treponema pedis TaxID=409322 RepID=S5ZVK6_9SPIR|nr:SsrA-binding protein SmpB [Treponema pedis]AGT44330.1 SsrA-binding protein [Treponema pedis str. T A4]QOW62083.1 SsrA-binding protein SmpB [Treponema pedis]
MESGAVKIIAKNKKAFFNYTVEEKIECGLVLKGTEVKSLREGRISFPDAFAEIKENEVWVKNFHISEYIYSSIFNHNPARPKKLLLKKEEIKRLKRKVDEKGYTLVPLEFYFKNGIVKVLLGVCKGKKAFDKRASIKEQDVKRDVQRELRARNKE